VIAASVTILVPDTARPLRRSHVMKKAGYEQDHGTEQHRKRCDKCIQAHPRLEKKPASSSSWKRALSRRPDAMHPCRKVARSEIRDPVWFFSGVTTIASI